LSITLAIAVASALPYEIAHSSGPTYLSVKHDQLVITREREVVGTVPCEDIGVVIVDHPAVTYTHGVLTTLARFGGVVIACGPDHHPASIIHPLEANTLHTERLRLQVESSRPCSKRIWQQIVRAKVRAQADNLTTGDPAHKRLITLAAEVRSGDPANVEAQAAKVYWKALFPGDAFRRDPDGAPPNNLLNYGYMALRAAVARAIGAAGLHPSIGLHHRNRYNPFCLADDLMEPLRPVVDLRVQALWSNGQSQIDRETKTELLGLMTDALDDLRHRGRQLDAHPPLQHL
jgi:CRISPR-associated protein Cas1